MRETLLSWQKILAQGFTTAAELFAFLSIVPEPCDPLVEQQFKTRVPLGFARRMQSGNRQDPLLLQVLATQAEMEIHPEFVLDPLEESNANKLPGLIHKYQGRVLLTLTGTCAINCRYCFRRHFPYQDNNPGRLGWQAVVDYIAQDSSIKEVILSGGDPLLATNKTLNDLIQQLDSIAHVQTLRIHTRIPVVLPERVEEGLVSLLAQSRLQKVVVIHSNHPNELDITVKKACAQLKQANCFLLNQSVLLKGINDDASILAALSQGLFAIGVLPYYLHLLDKVKGVQHFEVSLTEASILFHELQTLLPGYLVPRMASEDPRCPYKTIYGRSFTKISLE